MTTPTQSLADVRARLKTLLDERQYDIARDGARAALDECEGRLAWFDSVAERRGGELNAGDARTVAAIKADIDEFRQIAETAQRLEDAAGRRQVSELRSQYAENRDASRRAAEQWADRNPNPGGRISVGNESRTYHEGNRHEVSFLRDAWAMRAGDSLAGERIARSQREAGVELRDVTTSTFNGLIPPAYLVSKFAPLARAGRPFADVVPTENLPAIGMSLIVTKTTTGTATAVQTTQNSAATETNMVTTDITVPVVSITGQQDVSRQAIERGQVSDAVLGDLLLDYYTKLDTNYLTGGGSSGASLGILNAATTTQTWTGTTVASFISKVIGSLNDVATGISAPATCIVMHPRRWHWLLAQSDTNGRPYATPYAGAAQNPGGIGGTGYGVGVGTLAGLPVVADANIGTSYGVSTNEDRIIVTRLDRLCGWEAPVMSFRFDEAVGAPQTIRLAVFGYSAFTAERYVSGTSLVVGSGLVAPSF